MFLDSKVEGRDSWDFFLMSSGLQEFTKGYFGGATLFKVKKPSFSGFKDEKKNQGFLKKEKSLDFLLLNREKFCYDFQT